MLSYAVRMARNTFQRTSLAVFKLIHESFHFDINIQILNSKTGAKSSFIYG